MSKSPISGWTRAQVFERDGHRCQYCGSTDALGLDHIIPMDEGGSHEAENLRVACHTCNSTKRNRSVEWFREFIAFGTTKYAGVITLRQYRELSAIGVELDPLPAVSFLFEHKE